MSLNSFEQINPHLVDAPLPKEVLTDGQSGYSDEVAAGDTMDAIRDVCGAASRDFPSSLWIEPKDWNDRARDNDKYHTWGMNYLDRYTNQSPTHECTCHSLRANFEAARNKQLGIIFPDGPKKGYRYEESKRGIVWVSPLSIYAEANPGKWGGANVRQVMEIACRRGFLPDRTQPFEYNFKHTLSGTNGQGNINQSNGDWVALKNFPSGWQDTAKWFKPLEVIFPGSWEEAVCLVLHGMLVSVGRNGHAIPWAQWNVESQVMAYPDSYDITRYDSLRTIKSAWSGAFAIATVTAPDEWMKPAG